MPIVTQFIYTSGTIKVAGNKGEVFVDGTFGTKKELRKILFLYSKSDVEIIIRFDDPLGEGNFLSEHKE